MKTTRPGIPVGLLIAALSASAACAPAAFAQSQPFPYESAQPQAAFTQQELDRMLAPIALYPDALLSQILMASTYPQEVIEASRWSRANSRLRGDDAVRAVEREDWDPSVKSLVAFPQILAMMDERPDWTQRLGDAFLDAEPLVMDTVQTLRQRAMAAGNLQSDHQIRVARQDRIIVLEPANPQLVYVPYYDPQIIYGAWWWPAPPVYWAPWAGYHAPRPGVRVGFYWGSGVNFSVNLFFGGFDWRQRQVVRNHYVVVNRTVIVNRSPQVWQHAPEHRRSVPYRSANVQQRFAGPDYGNRGPRRDVNRDSTDRDGRPDFAPSAAQRNGQQPGARDNARDRDGNRDGGPPARQETQRNDGDRTPEHSAVIPQRPSNNSAQVRPDRGEERRDADNRGRDRRDEVRQDTGRRDGGRRDSGPDRDGRNDGGRAERRTQAAPSGGVPLASAAPTAQGAPTARAVVTAPVQPAIRAEARSPVAQQRPAESRALPAPAANRPEIAERGRPGRSEAARNESRRDTGERGADRSGDRGGEKGNGRTQREGRV